MRNSQNCTRFHLVEILDCYSYNYSLKGQCVDIAAMKSYIISQPIISLIKRNFVSIQLKCWTADSALQLCMSYNNIFMTTMLALTGENAFDI